MTTASPATLCSTYKGIKAAFDALISPTGAYSTSNPFGRADLFGQAVRYSFHDAGEIDIRVADGLGPDGCLSNTGANAGIIEATSLIESVMDPIWQSFCDTISRSDFFVLFAKLAVEASSGNLASIPYQYGRRHNIACSGGASRLPDANLGLAEFQRVFVTQMGLTLANATILLGAHTVGHVHRQHSGFGLLNASTNIVINAFDTTPTVFENLYYDSLIRPNWVNIKVPGSSTLNIWRLGSGKIMLNVDMSLAFPIDLSNQGSCLSCGTFGQTCGSSTTATNAFGGVPQCASPAALSTNKTVSTLDVVKKYKTQDASTNALFLADFAKAFVFMTSVGYPSLTKIDFSTCPL